MKNYKQNRIIRILLVFMLMILMISVVKYIHDYYIVSIFRTIPLLDEVYSPDGEFILKLYYKRSSATTDCMVMAELDSTTDGFHKCIYKGYHVDIIEGCWLDTHTVRINNAELDIHHDVFNNMWIDPRKVVNNPMSLEAVRTKIPSNIFEKFIDYFVKYIL